MGIPWDGTGIYCYVMGQTNMSHAQSWQYLPLLLGITSPDQRRRYILAA